MSSTYEALNSKKDEQERGLNEAGYSTHSSGMSVAPAKIILHTDNEEPQNKELEKIANENEPINLKINKPLIRRNISFKTSLRQSTKCCFCMKMTLQNRARIWLGLFGLCIIWALIEEFTLMQYISNDDDWYHYFTMAMIFKDAIGGFIIFYAIWALHYSELKSIYKCFIYFILALLFGIAHLIILFLMNETTRKMIGIGVYILCQIMVIDTFRKIYSLSKYYHQSYKNSIMMQVNN